MHRDVGQSSLAESLLPETLNNERLQRIDRWKSTRRVKEGRRWSRCYCQWYSDPQMEEALGDRISPVCGARMTHLMISRFRAMLTERGVVEGLMEELNRQLEEKGMMVKAGTLMDATLVESQGRRVSKKEECNG